MLSELKIRIPEVYVWMTEGKANRSQLFKRYVIGYIARTHPDLKVTAIKGLYAICERT